LKDSPGARKVEKANKVQRLQGMIGNPTKREFAKMVREKLITKSFYYAQHQQR
jgi:hypothetical protein